MQSLENAGIVHTCAGRDTTVKVHPTFASHELVNAVPSTTPPEIKDLLDGDAPAAARRHPSDPGQHRRR